MALNPVLFEEKITQRDDVTFWIYNEADPAVLKWLKEDCSWAFWLTPKFQIEAHSMGSQFTPQEWGKEVKFMDKGGALEFKLRWYKNA